MKWLQESKHRKTDRGLFFIIKKKESGPYWPRLQKEGKKVCARLEVVLGDILIFIMTVDIYGACFFISIYYCGISNWPNQTHFILSTTENVLTIY